MEEKEGTPARRQSEKSKIVPTLFLWQTFLFLLFTTKGPFVCLFVFSTNEGCTCSCHRCYLLGLGLCCLPQRLQWSWYLQRGQYLRVYWSLGWI
jgi:hypothetical protein